ncbi:hypothetical protein [Enterobacter cloacae]|uniref:hypothetical protein n=1 Tax=Enterobacter cloacae TaxID=550 RepID=UPI000B8D1E8F|nr:hypothetical protein [Enterobacter cloacae]ASQ15692.1 hypothetical protein BJM06_a00043 [Enterobacter cloacae]
MNQAQQRLDQAQKEKEEAENRLNALRTERQAREAAEAQAKAEAEARVNDEKEALTKASELITGMGKKLALTLAINIRQSPEKLRKTLKTFRVKSSVPMSRPWNRSIKFWPTLR